MLPVHHAARADTHSGEHARRPACGSAAAPLGRENVMHTSLPMSRDDFANYDTFLRRYVEERASVGLGAPALRDAHDHLRSRPDLNRLMTALFDLVLEMACLACDFFSPEGLHFAITSARSRQKTSPKRSYEDFCNKMSLYRNVNAFVLRYRAQWDKVLGFLVLLYFPDQYEGFVSANSRRKRFIKLAASSPILQKEIIPLVENQVAKFEGSFRTPEAHGAGVLRKWLFSGDSIWDTPTLDLVAYWNALAMVMQSLDTHIRDAPKPA